MGEGQRRRRSYDGGEECEDGDGGWGAVGLALDEVGGEAEDDEDEGELRCMLSVKDPWDDAWPVRTCAARRMMLP